LAQDLGQRRLATDLSHHTTTPTRSSPYVSEANRALIRSGFIASMSDTGD
jgi:hypothetical protein